MRLTSYSTVLDEDHSPQHLAAAKDAAETALRLEPNREEARLALARYYYHGLSDYRRTEQELSSIPSSAPHEVEFFTLASLVERRLGQFAASIRDGEKAVELDPQNASLAASLVADVFGVETIRRFRARCERSHCAPAWSKTDGTFGGEERSGTRDGECRRSACRARLNPR